MINSCWPQLVLPANKSDLTTLRSTYMSSSIWARDFLWHDMVIRPKSMQYYKHTDTFAKSTAYQIFIARSLSLLKLQHHQLSLSLYWYFVRATTYCRYLGKLSQGTAKSKCGVFAPSSQALQASNELHGKHGSMLITAPRTWIFADYSLQSTRTWPPPPRLLFLKIVYLIFPFRILVCLLSIPSTPSSY